MKHQFRIAIKKSLLLSAILLASRLAAQETADLPEEHPPPILARPVTDTIATGTNLPRLIEPVTAPAPAPAPAVKPYTPDSADIRDEKTVEQGGRHITYQRVNPLPVPPPPEPLPQPTAAERAAFSARAAALRASHPRERFILLGGSLYLSDDRPPRALCRQWPVGGGEPVTFWTNIDLRDIQSLGRFVGTDGTQYQFMMMWSVIDISRTAAAWSSKGRAYRPPALPDFPNETPAAAGQPAALTGAATFIPLATADPKPAGLGIITELHKIYNQERPRLHAAAVARENARLAAEAELKANPPAPQDITLRYWLRTTAPQVPADPAPPPSAPSPAKPRRARGARASRPQGKTGVQPVTEDRCPACPFRKAAKYISSVAPAIAAYLLTLLPASAKLDLPPSANGYSDIWEYNFNSGGIFPYLNPAADDDGDGLTNSQEESGGTDPRDANPPAGVFRPEAQDIPAHFETVNGQTVEVPRQIVLTWTGVYGKRYTPFISVDLVTWTPFSAAVIADGTPIQAALVVTPAVPRQFIRISVDDADRDNDGLTDYEEHVLTTDPLAADSDGDGLTDKAELEWTAPDGSRPLSPLDPDYDKDGISDGVELTDTAEKPATNPIGNNAAASPDTAGHYNPATDMPGSFFTGLRAYWTFEETTAANGKTYYPSLVNSAAADAEITYPKPADPSGLISRSAALPAITGGFPKAPPTALTPATSCTVSFWFKCAPGAIQAKTGRSTFFALHNGTAGNPILAFSIEKSTAPASGQILKVWRGDGAADLTALLPYGSYLDDGKWRHIALVRDQYVSGYPDLRIHIDGTLLASGKSLPGPYTATSAGYFMIGGWSTALPGYGLSAGLSASLDRFSIHDRALTAAGIGDIYNCDSEHDTLADRVETAVPVWRDANSNKSRDAGEITHISSPFVWDDPNDDADADGLTNANEHLATGTDPGDPDTDGDLMPDGWEILNGLDPNNPADATQDPDGDGLTNLDEYRSATDPADPDTDNDGSGDLAEILGPDGIRQNPVDPSAPGATVSHDDATDPNDPADTPASPRPASEQVEFKLGVGDRSGSHSEDYVLNVFRIDPVSGAEQRVHTLRSGGHGQYAEIYKSFRKGETYTFQIQWLGTSNATGTSQADSADWDYHLVAEPQGVDTRGILIDSYDPVKKTIDTAASLRDPQDTTPVSDDDDNIENFPKSHQTLRIVFLTAALTPDWNRDGKIDLADRGKATAATPWRFWTNDDDDTGDTTGTDTPGADAPDYRSFPVGSDGIRDLVDFFPVRLEIAGLLGLFPPAEFTYRLRHQSQTAAGGVLPAPSFGLYWFSELAGDSAAGMLPAPEAYLKQPAGANILAAKETVLLGAGGLVVPTSMLASARLGGGAVVLEGRFPTTNPLRLEITSTRTGAIVHTLELPVSISGVEDMFRHRFIGDDPLENTPGIPAAPSNWPDAECNGRHFIMLHGYNVSADQARGTFSDFFKKLFWSGSKAMFTGISWHGNESQLGGSATPDYWRNVHNAFLTAPSVPGFVAALPGTTKHIAAHSLGNMVVSSAIADHGLQVADYFMLDAAVAVEAYSPGAAEQSNMIRPDWRGTYESRLRASEWWKLFPAGDARRGLSWRGRFGAFPNAYNFHSTGEEVLRNSEGPEPSTLDVATSGGVLSWAKQEMSKGRDILGGGGILHQGNGGWEFNTAWYLPEVGLNRQPRTPAEASSLTGAHISVTPFFKPFKVTELTDPTQGPAATNDLDKRALTLAEAIPATTFAAGRNPLPSFESGDPNIEGRNYDMPSDIPNGWPLSRTTDPAFRKRGWLHGDYRDVAFLYTYKVYGKITELANLKSTNQ